MLVYAATLACCSGCALFHPGSAVERLTSERPFLPPLQPERNVVDLEVYFVDRVIGDPTIGDGLWRVVNQADGALATHARLREVGIQYGVSPSSPPPALQSLISRGFGASSTKLTSVQHIPLLNGASAPIRVSTLPTNCTIPSSGKNKSGTLQVQNASCVFLVAAEKLQEGWVKVAFLPQVLHGADQLRPVATAQSWQSQGGQQVEAYYDSEFSLELNTGEFVVVGLASEQPDTLGNLFFRSGEPQGRFQRVMIVRLAGMQHVKPQRSQQMAF